MQLLSLIPRLQSTSVGFGGGSRFPAPPITQIVYTPWESRFRFPVVAFDRSRTNGSQIPTRNVEPSLNPFNFVATSSQHGRHNGGRGGSRSRGRGGLRGSIRPTRYFHMDCATGNTATCDPNPEQILPLNGATRIGFAFGKETPNPMFRFGQLSPHAAQEGHSSNRVFNSHSIAPAAPVVQHGSTSNFQLGERGSGISKTFNLTVTSTAKHDKKHGHHVQKLGNKIERSVVGMDFIPLVKMTTHVHHCAQKHEHTTLPIASQQNDNIEPGTLENKKRIMRSILTPFQVHHLQTSKSSTSLESRKQISHEIRKLRKRTATFAGLTKDDEPVDDNERLRLNIHELHKRQKN